MERVPDSVVVLGDSDTRVGPFGDSRETGAKSPFRRVYPAPPPPPPPAPLAVGSEPNFPGGFMFGFEHYVKIEGPLMHCMHDVFLGQVL